MTDELTPFQQFCHKRRWARFILYFVFFAAHLLVMPFVHLLMGLLAGAILEMRNWWRIAKMFGRLFKQDLKFWDEYN